MTLDLLAHTRPLFGKDRVVAGPDRFYALSRFNLFAGPVRHTQEAAEEDADRFHAFNEKHQNGIIAWGALG